MAKVGTEVSDRSAVVTLSPEHVRRVVKMMWYTSL